MGAPSSTYRLQLSARFPFAAAQAIAGYLSDLGVGAVYTSPILRPARGSSHGYDLVDPTQIDPALGGEEAFTAWADDLGARGMARIVDFVPNHVGVATGENAWWNDVLQNGACSLFADFFDIDWEPPKRALHGKVLLPVLARPYGEAIERGDLRLGYEGGCFFVTYADRRLPVSPTSVAPLLREAAHACCGEAADHGADEARLELEAMAAAVEALPTSMETSHDRRVARAKGRDALERRLHTLVSDSEVAARAVQDAVARRNGQQGARASFDALDALLQAQCYRLSDWRVAPEEVNYRRFFDVSDLAAVRMEEPGVFAAMHWLVLRLVAAGRIDGLRLDHTDGLSDPGAYFVQLRRALADACGGAEAGRGIYVVAEKVLGNEETLPRAWPIDGTTGYDFLGHVGGLWVDPKGESRLTAIHQAQTGQGASFPATAWASKRLVMRRLLWSEVTRLAQALEVLAGGRRRSRDFTLRTLSRALVETLAALDVYRTYVRPDGSREASDERRVQAATARARRQSPDIDPAVFTFIEDMALLRVREDVGGEQRAAQVRFGMHLQQLSGAVMAKGVEDTAFYRHVPLLSLNEVGAHPDLFGTSIADFHADGVRRRELWKGSMLATSTHDTKRAEDARARLAVLSEIPEAWREELDHWNALAASHLTPGGSGKNGDAPSAADQYYFHQSMVGALPYEDLLGISDDFIERASEHMTKATREAKRETSWGQPDARYDLAVQRFVRGMLRDPIYSARLRCFVHHISAAGASNALGQLVLKLTAPGVPDVYQGTELWTFDFCDPDNRRPVDYALRRRRLSALPEQPTPHLAAELLRRFEDGTIKLHVCRTLLRLRRALPAFFRDGSYAPIDAGEDVVAFERQGGGRRLVVACARFPMRRTGGAVRWALGRAWREARIAVAPGQFVDVLTGEKLPCDGELALRDVFEVLPVTALLQ
jgi:(1->4)-alpha-D-glucan 1-alpha-D-glucosylmutase